MKNALDVFLLVELGDVDVLSSRNKRDRDKLAEPLLLGRECVLNDVRDVVVPTYVKESTIGSENSQKKAGGPGK